MNIKKLLIIPFLLFVFGVSYAFFQYVVFGENGNEIVAGQIYMKYADANTLYLTNIFPETREKALSEGRTDNEIRFSIKGKNEYKKDIYYEINLNFGDEIENENRIHPEDIMIYLECDGKVLIDGMTYKDWNKATIWVNTIPANTKEEITKNYILKVWVRDDILISDSNPNANYTTDEWNNSYISLKLSAYGDFVEKKNLYIYDVQLFDKANANEAINMYDDTYFNSRVELSNDINAKETYVTYSVTIRNNSPYLYSYSDAIFTLGDDTYDNENIVFDITELNKDDEIGPGESKTFYITFRYDDPTSVENNVLNSKINFSFKNLSAMPLGQLILDNESENVNNFYKYGDTYYFSGNNPNNYVWFNCQDGYESGASYCEKWRIVSVDEKGFVKIVKHDVVDKEQITDFETKTDFWKNIAGTWVRDSKILASGKIIYDYKGKRPLDTSLADSYCISTNNGCNAYSSDVNIITGSYKNLAVDRDSMMKMYLEEVYYRYGLTTSALDRIKKSTLNIGLVGVGLNIDGVLSSERSVTCEANIGLLNVSDYVFSSNDENCKTEFTKYYNNSCVTNNWLKFDGKQYLMLNGKILAVDDKNAQVWTIRDDGAMYSQDATNEYYLRPVVTLKADTRAIGTGKNDEDDYYMIVY